MVNERRKEKKMSAVKSLVSLNFPGSRMNGPKKKIVVEITRQVMNTKVVYPAYIY
jgi:hypothetical protein